MLNSLGASVSGFLPVRQRRAAVILRDAMPYSAAGPDGVSALTLHECADALAVPVAILGRVIIKSGGWPDI